MAVLRGRTPASGHRQVIPATAAVARDSAQTPVAPLPPSGANRWNHVTGTTSTSLPIPCDVCSFQLPEMSSFQLPSDGRSRLGGSGCGERG